MVNVIKKSLIASISKLFLKDPAGFIWWSLVMTGVVVFGLVLLVTTPTVVDQPVVSLSNFPELTREQRALHLSDNQPRQYLQVGDVVEFIHLHWVFADKGHSDKSYISGDSTYVTPNGSPIVGDRGTVVNVNGSYVTLKEWPIYRDGRASAWHTHGILKIGDLF